jgi:hypothetical protein
MAHLLGGLSGWTAIAARTHRRYQRAGYLGSPLVVVGKLWLEQLTHPADDALRLVASYRMPEERSKSRGEMTPRLLPVPWQDSNLQPAVWEMSDCSGAAEVSVQGVKLSDRSWLRSMAVTGLASLIRPGGEAR